MRPLPDLSRRALEVAPELLGCILRVGDVGVRIVEVEAYEGLDDPASHAYRGPTPRSQTMFGLIAGDAPANIAAGPRVNVSKAADLPWRFIDAETRHVSAFKRHPGAR